MRTRARSTATAGTLGFAELDSRLLALYTAAVAAAFRSHLRYLKARELAAHINTIAARYRREPEDPDPRPGTVRAVLQFQLLPDEMGDTQE